MAYPQYAKQYNFKPVFRGDSLIMPVIEVAHDNSSARVLEATMQIRDDTERLVQDVQLDVRGSTISADMVSTSSFPVGILNYDIKVLLTGGLVRTYLYGKIEIVRNVTDVQY